MKKEIRLMAFHETGFNKYSQKTDKKTNLVSAVFRGSHTLEDVSSSTIEVDGDDSTQKMIDMVLSSKHLKQLRYILLSSSTYAGLNVVDLPLLYQKTGIPVMAVIRGKKPNSDKIKKVLTNLGMNHKLDLVDRAGPFYEDLGIYFQLAGMNQEDAINLLDLTMIEADYPEPLRITKIIANGFKLF